MKSKLLSNLEILDYVRNHNFFKDSDNLKCIEIGDGNINYVFKVSDNNSGKSIIVKQSDVYLRSSGRPLDINRSEIEYNALISQYKNYPGSVPKVYFYDKERSVIIMEDISSYKNLRKELKKGNIYNHLSDSLSEFLKRTLIPMTDYVLSRKEKKLNVKKFINPDLCDITEDLVLTEPYFNYKDRNIINKDLIKYVEQNIYEDKKLICEVLKLKDNFQSNSQALIHGDLHTGSIFVNENGIKVIDPEFSFYGPMGYDIGNVWGNISFALANSLILKDKRKNALNKLLEETIDMTIFKLYDAYDKYIKNEYFKNELFKQTYISEVIADSFGYAGTEIIRRDIGDSKVEEITSLKDRDKRKKLDILLINFGKYLILNRYKIKYGKEVVDYINNL
ncbi:S-methyl-5-thioribose kinase [Anaerococcus sp. WCA-380-WT-2B]|uniref:S-methyl-5-thioribose kinase n=1 Tax=Anaerococcus porci TaxID=2652269 RepID=A0A6N7VDJ5_9FIRM|nr:S-methyl-5-thioribose kinase [Anaerococcus porci]MSS77528.1 S-methyl-5-thioribose kinase [Anaerococcus porci]